VARVSIFEDDPVIARLLSMLFLLEGHDVESVTTAEAVWRRLEGPAPDLLLLDVMLDGADGIDVLTHLRAQPTWADCRVIVVSALSTDDDVWRGWAAGADYYLTKPFDAAHLRGVSERLLQGAPPAAGGGETPPSTEGRRPLSA
jgi:DNA-binding response OmpR family regulator